jgi:hypothetical protein
MHSRGEAIRYVKRTRAASWALPDEQLRRLTG